jgi:hypothetical protein
MMFKPLLIVTLLVLGQKPEVPKPPEFGIIAGSVIAPAQAKISQPLQVVLLAPQYVDMWNRDVQQRLDVYWERYKPAFAQKKELFFELSKNAYQESLQFVLGRMSRDLGTRLATYRGQSTADGKFEFKDIPVGEYKVVAIGRAGDQTYIWQESTEITSSIPQFLQLKNRVP